MAGLRRALVAIAAALALADASIVALALPPILVEFDTTITGVAAVVGVYALVLALGDPARRPASTRGARGRGACSLFAAASVGCALAGSLWVLLLFRALQAAGGAAALLTAFEVLDAGESRAGRRLWLGAALVGTAAGPAIGGVLTELFDWRAIFAVQAPLAAAAALACLASREPALVPACPRRGGHEPLADEEPEAACGRTASPRSEPRRRGRARRRGQASRWRPGDTVPASEAARLDQPAPFRDHVVDLGKAPPRDADAASEQFAPARPSGTDTAAHPRRRPRRPATTTSRDGRGCSGATPRRAHWPRSRFTAAAFTAVLFLLVIELVAGFAISPLRAALGVTILPLAALAAAVIPGSARPRALAGAVLLAGGAAALAFLPAPSIAWTVVPQLLAGRGHGPRAAGLRGRAAAGEDRRRGRAQPRRAPRRDRRRARDPRPGRHRAARERHRPGDPAGHGARARRADRPAEEARARARRCSTTSTSTARAPRSPKRSTARRAEFADDARRLRPARRSGSTTSSWSPIQDAFQIAYLIAAALALARRRAAHLGAGGAPAVWLATGRRARTRRRLRGRARHPRRRRRWRSPTRARERALPDTGGITGRDPERGAARARPRRLPLRLQPRGARARALRPRTGARSTSEQSTGARLRGSSRLAARPDRAPRLAGRSTCSQRDSRRERGDDHLVVAARVQASSTRQRVVRADDRVRSAAAPSSALLVIVLAGALHAPSSAS